jgi:hypothetical protein
MSDCRINKTEKGSYKIFEITVTANVSATQDQSQQFAHNGPKLKLRMASFQ